ncbi:MAG: hypothetical protein EU540_02475 [Promethearchaeota archaeon]|nr:MAG: hypothetical protein EU540_02475 [Candidatus Lokiarchaeota archaeon]
MNKRILYALIFTSIFILSTVSMVAQPAAGAHWKLGIPEQSRGTEVEREVKIYDKDAWGEHLGDDNNDKVKEKFGGDADEVDARSKIKINDWEGEKINVFADHLMTRDLPTDEKGMPLTLMGKQLTEYWSLGAKIDEILAEGAWRNDSVNQDPNKLEVEIGSDWSFNVSNGAADSCAPFSYLEILTKVIYESKDPSGTKIFDFGVTAEDNYGNYDESSPWAIANWSDATHWRSEVGLLNKEEAIETFAKEYSGTEVEINSWDFVEKGNYESDPDEKEEILPILKDPHDYLELYNQFHSYWEGQVIMVNQIIQGVNQMRRIFRDFKDKSMATIKPEYGNNQSLFWDIANESISLYLRAMYNLSDDEDKKDLYVKARQTGNLVDLYLEALLDASGDNLIQQYMDIPSGLNYIKYFILDVIPLQKKEFLAFLFEEGLYAMQPVDKYLEKIIDDFDIDEDAVWGDDLEIDGMEWKDDLNNGGITVEGRIVSVKYEWVGNIYDIPDTEEVNPLLHDPREDYKIIYTYGDTGGQISIEYEGSETFFKIENIAPLIPGYEITILLASAAISALAIIYVVMKKKRM